MFWSSRKSAKGARVPRPFPSLGDQKSRSGQSKTAPGKSNWTYPGLFSAVVRNPQVWREMSGCFPYLANQPASVSVADLSSFLGFTSSLIALAIRAT